MNKSQFKKPPTFNPVSSEELVNMKQQTGRKLPYIQACRNFSNFFLKTTISVISVHILPMVSMGKYILNHK